MQIISSYIHKILANINCRRIKVMRHDTKKIVIKNPTEILACWTLSKLLASGTTVKFVESQSHGEHDFDVLDSTQKKIGVVEVTAAIHERSKLSFEREKRQWPIQCPALQKGWLLMAHNPDPRWVKNKGSKHLAVFEENGLTEFDLRTQMSQNQAVAYAATKLNRNGIENGEAFDSPGNIGFLTSRGETSDAWIISHERVTEILIEALELPDNTAKLSATKHGASIDRHFFVEIDRHTHPAAGSSMEAVNPPSGPTDLKGRATHVWAAMQMDGIVVVWRGNSSGWTRFELPRDSDLDTELRAVSPSSG